MYSKAVQEAAKLWKYMASLDEVKPSDAIVVCCSYDIRVCDYGCQLIDEGYSDRLVFSGNTGNWTRQLWSTPEAEIFNQRALDNGLSPDQIILESRATNLGENISFTRQLLPEAKVITFISKPNVLLRIHLTAKAQWPEITHYVSCPKMSFPEDASNTIGLLGIVNEMVGDLERIQKYPALGFQAPHKLPEEIINSWQYLINQGFDQHLMK